MVVLLDAIDKLQVHFGDETSSPSHSALGGIHGDSSNMDSTAPTNDGGQGSCYSDTGG